MAFPIRCWSCKKVIEDTNQAFSNHNRSNNELSLCRGSDDGEIFTGTIFQLQCSCGENTVVVLAVLPE